MGKKDSRLCEWSTPYIHQKHTHLFLIATPTTGGRYPYFRNPKYGRSAKKWGEPVRELLQGRVADELHGLAKTLEGFGV